MALSCSLLGTGVDQMVVMVLEGVELMLWRLRAQLFDYTSYFDKFLQKDMLLHDGG